MLFRSLAEGRCVYLHCLAGVSRTGLVLTAWQMNRARQGPATALQALREKRPCLQPNSGFLALLAQWEAKLGR